MAGGVRGGKPLQAVLLGGAAGAFVTPDELDVPLTFEGVARRSRRRSAPAWSCVFDERIDLAQDRAAHRAFFRDESCGQCVPCRVGTVRQEEAVDTGWRRRDRTDPGASRASAARRNRSGHARRVDLRSRARPRRARVESAIAKFDLFADRSGHERHARDRRQAGHRRRRSRRCSTHAARSGSIRRRLCYLENLTPVNVCRVCVVELEGARTLVPACSRKCENGMKVKTDSERVRLSRRDGARVPGVVRRRLARGRHAAPDAALRRGAARYGSRRHPAGERDRRRGSSPPHDGRTPKPSHSRSRSTTICTSATTRSAFSATSASKRAAPTRRTRSRSRSRAADSTRTSRPNTTCRCPTRRASTAATASASVRPVRSCSRPSTTCAKPARGTNRGRRKATRSARTAASAARSPSTRKTTDRQGDVADRSRRDARSPVHQGPLRLAVRGQEDEKSRKPATPTSLATTLAATY